MGKLSDFEQELRESLYIHKALPLHREQTLEAGFPKKKVINRKVIWENGRAFYEPEAAKEGEVKILEEDGCKVISLQADLTSDHWPAGAPSDGDYTNFGTAAFTFHFPKENWEGYNRLHFTICPRVSTARVLHLNVSVTNVGKVPIPDPYFREGATVFDLQNEKWNDCIWEFDSMARDEITELTFYVFLSGQAADWKDRLIYDIKDVWLEQVENPEKEKGWECKKDSISLSSAGYFPQGRKEAVANVTADTFTLRRAETDCIIIEETVKQVSNERGHFQVLDFSSVTEEGLYYLQAGEVKSPIFAIAKNLCEEAVWKIINFVYNLRCGTPIPGKHSTCHVDSLAEHNGVKISFAGGWHDAGDLSQQVAQTGEMVHAFFQAAEKYRNNTLLHARLIEEAQWGLDFVLRTRFGDGFRATSAGATRFTDNKIGDFDDVAVRVFDHSYENFLFSGIEAYACYALRTDDKETGVASLRAAKEDFDFAEKKFAETGVDPAHMYEHTYNSGLSQYYAVIVWAAANLYLACEEEKYADKAAEYAQKLMACQEIGEAGLPISGFFYRDETHKSIVHFNHQSREYQFVQALVLLCRVLPQHKDFPAWRECIRKYAEYQKAIVGNTAPYGMIPAGIHRMDEPDDKEIFPYLHILVDYKQEYPHYKEQLAQGHKIDDMHVLKNFPVWFSFRGNSAILLASGIAAAQAGHFLEDEAAVQIGREQLYWMWGKNPFGQSLQYGVGSNYCCQYGVYVGECVGEVPVGIETYGDEDIPYWPQNNNATFREVWIGVACRMLWLMSEYAE